MDRWWSIRSSRRVRTDRGFALVTALLLALLFIGVIDLALADAVNAQRQARRFRERIMSQILADNAVELAAADMVGGAAKAVERRTDEGEMSAELEMKPNGAFTIEAEGVTAALGVRSRVTLRGRTIGSNIIVQESRTR